MKYFTLLAIVACGLTAACTVRNERTVVQPVPTTTTTTAPVVYTDPPPGSRTTTTVYTPAR